MACGACLKTFRMLWIAASKFQRHWFFCRPRCSTCRKFLPNLICPYTGSAVICRSRYFALPTLVDRNRFISSRRVMPLGFRPRGAFWFRHSLCVIRPVATSAVARVVTLDDGLATQHDPGFRVSEVPLRLTLRHSLLRVLARPVGLAGCFCFPVFLLLLLSSLLLGFLFKLLLGFLDGSQPIS